MRGQFLKVLGGLALVGFLNACREKDPTPEVYELGVIVKNAGNYFDNNGSISFLRREKTVAENDLFFKENGRSFKGSVQDYAEIGGHSLVLVDNSTAGLDNVEIINFGTWKSEATLGSPDIENPRSVVGISPTKAYVSCWGATGSYPDFFVNPGYVAVIDLNTFKVIKKIPTPSGAERMVKVGDDVYVGNANKSKDLLVIDATTDAVKGNVTIGNLPEPIALDANGKLWVKTDFSVVRLNPRTFAIEATLPVGSDPLRTPSNFAIAPDGQGFYFVYSYYDPTSNANKGETYYFSINDTKINTTKPFVNRIFSGLGVDPLQLLIYGAVTPSYKQAGYVVRYRTDGSLVDSIKVDIAPSGFMFK
ncbi:YncE family protein [Salmonirosea aquatica]|uniref:DUF5074 domain-containing protein n=1 Tax=Salmonirosea aquatica TaxID=2654236 RepID=A0A7C9BDM2_9BACT|nr:DUF5074 domain-containing protein [Cytophagaceae bacterium SJW1-29]